MNEKQISINNVMSDLEMEFWTEFCRDGEENPTHREGFFLLRYLYISLYIM